MPVKMEHGPGKLFVSVDNGLSWKPLCETTGGVATVLPAECDEAEKQPMTFNFSEPVVMEMELLGEGAKNVRELLHPSIERHDAYLRRLLQGISRNRRATHLTMYARKGRVRKKNFHRYQRIIERRLRRTNP